MARRYRRRYYRSRTNWRDFHESKQKEISRIFAGIDDDIKQIFFSMSDTQLDFIFSAYGGSYGKNAEHYARKTFKQWKTGKTILSGQTAERLLQLIPPYLSTQQRFDLIKKLRNHYFIKKTVAINTTAEMWAKEIIPAFNSLVSYSATFTLPELVSNRVQWLTNRDAQQAQRILSAIEQDEAGIAKKYLEIEFKRIQNFIDTTPDTKQITHCIDLPQGRIKVNIILPKQTLIQKILGEPPMTKADKQVITKDEIENSLPSQNELPNLLDISYAELPEEDRKRLMVKASEANLDLQITNKKAIEDFNKSTADMQGIVHNANALEQNTNADFDIKATMKTASGKTDIHIKKNNNTVIIVVAIVLGIIIMTILSK